MIRRLLRWLAAYFSTRPPCCGRCGSAREGACWRVDCPRHEIDLPRRA